MQNPTKRRRNRLQYDRNDKLITKSIDTTAAEVVKYLYKLGLTVSFAESCTGGMLSESITSVSGASEIFECGVCSYSNRIKKEVLGVSEQTLKNFGAVSAETAREMSEGVKKLSGANIAVSVTGIAGPTGGTPEKPVGTVWLCVMTDHSSAARNLKLYDRGEELTRTYIRKLTTHKALEAVLEAAKQDYETRQKECL